MGYIRRLTEGSTVEILFISALRGDEFPNEGERNGPLCWVYLHCFLFLFFDLLFMVGIPSSHACNMVGFSKLHDSFSFGK
jgi:hypothetical protein